MAYPQVCPNCGGPVAPVALAPDTAPWLCAPCGIGWWVAELSAPAGAWQSGTRSFAHAALTALRASVDQEAAAARGRGTSALPEHLPLLTAGQLAALAARLAASRASGAAAMAAAVQAEVYRRKRL